MWDIEILFLNLNSIRFGRVAVVGMCKRLLPALRTTVIFGLYVAVNKKMSDILEEYFTVLRWGSMMFCLTLFFSDRRSIKTNNETNSDSNMHRIGLPFLPSS